MAPLEAPPAEAAVSIPLLGGVEGTADKIGWTLVGASAVGIAAHATYSYAVKHSRESSKKTEE